MCVPWQQLDGQQLGTRFLEGSLGGLILMVTYACDHCRYLNYNVFFMLICYVTLWPWPLTRWLWKFMVRQLSCDKVCMKYEWNRAIPGWIMIILRIFAHVMLRCDFHLWPLDLELLQHFGCPVFKLCTTFERNRVIRSWVVDDLTTHAILGGGAELAELSQVCVDPTSPNLTRT